MHVDTGVGLSVKMKIPIDVLVHTMTNLLVRDVRWRGESSIEDVVKRSVSARRLRNNPRQTLAEIINRLDNPEPTDYWLSVKCGLTFLSLDIANTFGISAPDDVWHFDHTYLVEWLKWVYVWSSAK